MVMPMMVMAIRVSRVPWWLYGDIGGLLRSGGRTLPGPGAASRIDNLKNLRNVFFSLDNGCHLLPPQTMVL